MLNKCPQCSGDMTVAALRTHPEEVHLVGTMTAHTSPVEARVCTECGYITLYAQTPSNLRLNRESNDKLRYEQGEFRGPTD